MPEQMIARRTLLAGSALVIAGGAAAAVAGCTDQGSASAASPSPTTPADPNSWDAVRAEFALDPQLAHFAAYVLATHPAPVRAAIERWREALDNDPATVVHEAYSHDEAVRAAASRYLRVWPDEIALTDSTTMGLGLVYHGLTLEPGAHVLTTTHDFYSTHEALRLAAERSGAEVEQVQLYDDPAAADADEITARIEAAIRPETRVVALTWVHSGTGVKLPVRQIADMLADANRDRDQQQRALLCIDGIHGLGVEEDGPNELGCDVLISGTHKWLFGPRGTGLVWAKPDVGESIGAIIPPFDPVGINNWLGVTDSPRPFYDAGTPGGYKAFEHRWAVTEAFEFHESIGRDRIAARSRELATQLKDGLSDVPGVRVVTPSDPQLSSGLVCCEVPGLHAGEAVEQLHRDHGIVASVTPYRDLYIRFGTSIVTTPEQVDQAVAAVAALA
ncbi:MAG TPA: aminotransferase class V-fold PLP-dependent enzyme [Jiangellaceae bacterium]|nr:aminotransferase class V-fold PLP-dependent enzyme [Jiangellaceae bacterium]